MATSFDRKLVDAWHRRVGKSCVHSVGSRRCRSLNCMQRRTPLTKSRQHSPHWKQHQRGQCQHRKRQKSQTKGRGRKQACEAHGAERKLEVQVAQAKNSPPCCGMARARAYFALRPALAVALSVCLSCLSLRFLYVRYELYPLSSL